MNQQTNSKRQRCEDEDDIIVTYDSKQAPLTEYAYIDEDNDNEHHNNYESEEYVETQPQPTHNDDQKQYKKYVFDATYDIQLEEHCTIDRKDRERSTIERIVSYNWEDDLILSPNELCTQCRVYIHTSSSHVLTFDRLCDGCQYSIRRTPLIKIIYKDKQQQYPQEQHFE